MDSLDSIILQFMDTPVGLSFLIARLCASLLHIFSNLIWKAMEKESIKKEKSLHGPLLLSILENLELMDSIVSSNYSIKAGSHL